MGGGAGAGMGPHWPSCPAGAGTLGATDPGATVYALGGPNPGPAGLGMIYAFGPAGSLTPAGLNMLLFIPNAGGNYDWAGT